ncbi:unnamed protein product [Linum tenue]|uniref:Uncharacterized protein n=1 Tax=Linum tenue TaxID=586396 RepID=A0AAV0JWG0_9ROSI|nr:unnamed protein product [Linum tenue]
MIADTGTIFQLRSQGEGFNQNLRILDSPLLHIFSRYGGSRSVESSSSHSQQVPTVCFSGYSWVELLRGSVGGSATPSMSTVGIKNRFGLNCGLRMVNMHLHSGF